VRVNVRARVKRALDGTIGPPPPSIRTDAWKQTSFVVAASIRRERRQRPSAADEERFHVHLKDAERLQVVERNVSNAGVADDHQRVVDPLVIALQDETVVAALKRPGGVYPTDTPDPETPALLGTSRLRKPDLHYRVPCKIVSPVTYSSCGNIRGEICKSLEPPTGDTMRVPGIRSGAFAQIASPTSAASHTDQAYLRIAADSRVSVLADPGRPSVRSGRCVVRGL
jgi:hypothetical protein